MRAGAAADLVDEGQQQRRGDEDEMDTRQHDAAGQIKCIEGTSGHIQQFRWHDRPPH